MSQMPFDPSAAARPGSGIFGLFDRPEDAGVVLIPVPWDATTSYRAGTSKGPAAILEASKQVDLFDIEVGRPYESGIAMLPESNEVRAWNEEARSAALPVIAEGGVIGGSEELAAGLARVNELGDRLNAWLRGEVERWSDRIVGVVGGDHSVPFSAIEIAAERSPGLGVLHVDAHADLREAYEGFSWSHASIMHNVITRLPKVGKIVQVGIRDLSEDELHLIRSSDRIETFFYSELANARFEGERWSEQCARIVGALPDNVYVSFDIDGLDPTLCPTTGTPVPGGLTFAEASYLLGSVVRSGRKIVGFDLNEVAPSEDDEWDANVGARLLYKMIGWTLRSRVRP
jgi:agmatinase